MSYAFNVTLQGDFEQAIEQVRNALAEEQLGIVSEINVQAIFKAKMDKDIAPYRIFGACNPKLAAELLETEPTAGTLLPCTFVMYATAPGQVEVSFMDPATVLGLANSAVAQNIGKTAKEKLQRVVAKLAA